MNDLAMRSAETNAGRARGSLSAPFHAPAVQFVICVATAIVLRAATFGNPNLFVDEAFYFAAGIEMTRGALPYIDIWDRKPFGHFALYWAIAAISNAPIAYQLAASIFAGSTAFVILRFANLHSKPISGYAAGLVYLCTIPVFSGYGGQSPVFYNALVAACGLIVYRRSARLNDPGSFSALCLAMALGGIALTLKQTVFFEVAAFGLWASISLYRHLGDIGKTLRMAVLWAGIGAAPTLAIAGFYFASGHWTEFWHAMALSNLSKMYELKSSLARAALLGILLAPLIALATLSLREIPRKLRLFCIVWLSAATLGFLIIPNFYHHYALSLLVPLCVAAASFFSRPIAGAAVLGALVATNLTIYPPFDFARTERTNSAINAIVTSIRKHDGGRSMLIYEGPIMLYALTGHRIPSPLAFPPHLSHGAERDVSHLETAAEVRRILKKRPGVIVDGDFVQMPPNTETRAMIDAYTSANCRLVESRTVPDRQKDYRILVYGDCVR